MGQARSYPTATEAGRSLGKLGCLSMEQRLAQRKKAQKSAREAGQTQILQGQGHTAGKPSIQPSSLLPWRCWGVTSYPSAEPLIQTTIKLFKVEEP